MRWSSWRIERDWHVIDKHVDRIHDLFAEVIRQGIEAGEFAEQDPVIASRCFGAATVILCHPQMVAQCLAKTNRAMPDELIELRDQGLEEIAAARRAPEDSSISSLGVPKCLCPIPS